MLIDKYFEYQLDYEKKYGDKTIVLMEVGSFFEAYGVNTENINYYLPYVNKKKYEIMRDGIYSTIFKFFIS